MTTFPELLVISILISVRYEISIYEVLYAHLLLMHEGWRDISGHCGGACSTLDNRALAFLLLEHHAIDVRP